jgi:hypothetical protein
MKRAGVVRLLVLLAILAAVAGVALAPPRAPQGQPPLQTLRNADLAAFRSAFNDAAGKVRVILLFSPT